MNIIHPRVVVLIPNLPSGIPRLGLAHLLSEICQTHKADLTERLYLKVFDFVEKYKDFTSLSQFSNEEKNIPFFLNYYSLVIFAKRSNPMFANFDIEIMETLIACLRKQTPSIRFVIVLQGDMAKDSYSNHKIVIEDAITPGINLQSVVFETFTQS